MIAEDSADTEHQVRLATAALLVEMMNQDSKVLESERRLVKEILSQQFDLTPEESAEMYSLAEEEVDNSTGNYPFTKLIAEHFSQAKKIQVIEALWQVAYIDQHLDAYEESMVRRIADLIYVSHSDFIRTKLKVQAYKHSE